MVRAAVLSLGADEGSILAAGPVQHVHLGGSVPDGRVQLVVSVGTIGANSGFGTIVAGHVTADQQNWLDQIGEVRFRGRLDSGTGTCPAGQNGANPSALCTLDWHTDATFNVTGGNVSDITRAYAVSPATGDEGKFGVDGWGGTSTASTPSLSGRFVFSTDDPIDHAT